jgi:16S rRNA (uracil1498-N3)-methyltransferase
VNPTRHRLWLEKLAPGQLVLGGERAHYLRGVLRLGVGDELAVYAGDGQRGRATVRAVSPDVVELVVSDVGPAPASAIELTVAVPAPKGERADWAVEKLTELGVARLVWITTERTVVVPKGQNRAARWQRLAEAAAKQAGRARTPRLDGPVSLDEVLAMPAERRYIAHPGGPPLVHEVASTGEFASAILLVGPEGGFTEAEVLRARASGYIAVGLGLFTLRMETAVIAGAAILSGAAAALDGREASTP